MTITTITIKNIRGFTDSASIPLKPITLLVGPNSSGKSTLARLVPLLKQSIETKTKGPILWYGPYVDFGSYVDSRPRQAPDSGTTISLDFNLGRISSRFSFIGPVPIYDDLSAQLSFTLGFDPETHSPYTKNLSLTIENHTIKFTFDPAGNCTSCHLGSGLLSLTTNISLVQESSLFAISASQPGLGRKEAFRNTRWSFGISRIELDELHQHVNQLFHGATQKSTKRSFLQNLGVGSIMSLRKALTECKEVSSHTLKNINRCADDITWISRLQGLLIASHSATIINILNDETTFALKGASYLGPVRATASRFYRQQDLSTDEIDPQGANTAMYLSGLTEDERAEFTNWCRTQMDFGVYVEGLGSHVSIYIEDMNDSGKSNIADMGFGFSQILPLLVSLWSSTRRREDVNPIRERTRLPFWGVDSPTQSINIVEQPELHLHPRMQAKLTDLYARLATSHSNAIQSYFILETHSETIVNRLGELIYHNRISKDDIVVLLVSRSGGSCSVSPSSYGSDGILQEWPYGFFLPDQLS